MSSKYQQRPAGFRHYVNPRRPSRDEIGRELGMDRQERQPPPKITLPRLRFMEREILPPSPRELPPRRGGRS